MKRMLKIFQVIGIVSLIAFITAVSCGKAGDGDNNNNNNANNSGGNGDGGAPDTNATIVITNIMTTVATPPIANPIKVDGTTISMKHAAFFLGGVGDTENFDDVLTETDGNLADDNVLRNKVFEFALKGASGGLVMVAPGNVASIGDFEAPAIAAIVPVDNAGNEGVFLVAAATESGFVAKGLNAYGVFMNTDATATYAFSQAVMDNGTGDVGKPKFYCRAVVPEITTTTPAATATLKGGEKAECFASYHGREISATWLGNATRKEIEIAVGAVRTDGKALSEIGITSAEFADGLSKADMAKLAAANKTDYKKFKITLVALNAF